MNSKDKTDPGHPPTSVARKKTTKKQQSEWTELPYGKHEGKTWPQIALRDPQYLRWAIKNQMFGDSQLGIELRTVYSRMRRIKVPQDGDGKWVVQYHHFYKGNVIGLEIVREDDEDAKLRWEKVTRMDHIDLLYPAQCASKSIGDSKLMIRDLRCYLEALGGNLTRKVCEDFFSNKDNFDSR